MNKNSQTVLITGGASGIGKELAKIFATQGYHLVLVDRNTEGLVSVERELSMAYQVTVTCFTEDLSQPEAATRLFEAFQEEGISPDVLVNNAGFGNFGNFWEIDLARDQALLNVNIVAPVLLTKLLLPAMIGRRRGKILNVGSVSGFSASPYATTYYSSKAFLLSFSTGLNSSLQGTGVTSTVVCPGPTKTAFDWREPAQTKTPARRKPSQMTAEDVAWQAYRGMQRGQAIVVPGWTNKALAILAKFLPRSLALKLVKRGQRTVN